jgi:hypothetical protein
MRALSTSGAAAIASHGMPLAVLVQMDFASGSIRLNTSSLTLTIGGNDYLGTGGLGKIGAIQDTPAELRGLTFELSGVSPSSIALVMTEPVQGRPVALSLVLFDPETYQVLDVLSRWVGVLDTLSIDDARPNATIQVAAEHAGIDLVRPSGSQMSDAEQQRLAPGDPSLQFVADQVDIRIVWPAAAFFRQ